MEQHETNLHGLRQSFTALHISDHPATQKTISAFKENLIAHAGNTFYEKLQSVSYNPDFKMLEAVFTVNQSSGYNGNLCSNGSFAFVRFYLDYGSGWIDQGYTGVNEHNIPTGSDCANHAKKPLSYSASLKIFPNTDYCDVHVLPKARAVLEWNKIPPSADPDYNSVWGNTVDDHIQIKPNKFLVFDNIHLAQLVQLAVAQPSLKFSDAAKLVPGGEVALQQSKATLTHQPLAVKELVDLYKDHTSVTPARYGLQNVHAALKSFDSAVVDQNIELWKQYQIDWAAIIAELEITNANINYEQIESVGLDYNLEQFVASLRIKRRGGYSGDLCSSGSLEYVAFWADWNNDCKWEYIGTTTVNVHDINDIPEGGLSYAAILPYNFDRVRKQCADPQVVKIRAVLSWNIAPSSYDADKLEYWGNRIDAYLQIKPGAGTGTLKPIINILGGISADEISDADGLTVPGAKFALNQLAVYDNSPFGGVITVQGPSFYGHRYRIKVTDLNTSATYYISNDFVITGFLMSPPYVQHTTVSANAITHYYDYQQFDKNTDNILARWSPGTNDLLKLELEIEGLSGVFTKYIQMDNDAPVISLQVEDFGDCSHFEKGDPIKGSYSVYDAHLLDYSLACTFGGDNIPNTDPNTGKFTFDTANVKSPCGKVSLTATEKTIYDSQWTNNSSYTERIICLQPQSKP